ncbi:hypothetical protein [Xanthovirga aplysinae]|uniref:hypothetical protein n=1 Tax=Xanthovirga aplysinae TaxID=2529853 RepID=UPI0012BC61C7|nr:hypothetical protein [Xanthovirga aplysinae]MTI30437.1 hypothetical protein [Xanthovirga aplysinae]
MKAMIKENLFKSLAISLILVVQLFYFSSASAQVEKEKRISKNYKVNKTTELKLSNKYGQVDVETWDKNEIDVEVVVKVKMRNEVRVQKILNKIEIEINENKDKISFETQLNGSINTSSSESFTIDYRIKMPKGNPLDLKNRFGDVFLDDFKGSLDLELAYGNLKARKLLGDKLSVDLSFGSGEVDELKSGNMDVRYFDLDIEHLGKVILENGFGKLTIGTADDLELDSRYGSVRIGEAGVVEASVGFAGFDLGSVSRSLRLVAKHANGIEIDHIAKTVEVIDVDADFSGVRLNFEKNWDANVDVKLSFAKLRYDKEDIDFNYVNIGRNVGEYKGKIGKGENSNIKISSSYGDVRLKAISN